MASGTHYRSEPPRAQGLYDPQHEHDACGVGFIVNIAGEKSHKLVLDAVQILVNLQHRGACGCEENTGDGAGILLQIPHKLLTRACSEIGITLPRQPGDWGAGMIFLPSEPAERRFCEEALERVTAEEGQKFLGWRDVPIDNSLLGATALKVEPVIRQAFIARGPATADAAGLEWKLYVIRKRMEKLVADSRLTQKKFFYVPSLSNRTIVYKGLLLATQISTFYRDLSDPDMETAIAMVHQRYSTN
ncbi:MAG: glutamate synthase subunit alpha, partial [Deltaproteobacteria bacterium]